MDATLLARATAGVAVAFYAHWRLGDFVRGRALWVHAFLVLLDIGVGGTAVATTDPPTPALAFLVGFGLVHVPPAIVLMLKGLRGEGRS